MAKTFFDQSSVTPGRLGQNPLAGQTSFAQFGQGNPEMFGNALNQWRQATQGMSEEEKKERVNFCLQRVNLLNANKLMPSEISGGMKKRVAIARAIAPNPKYLFCDEPNSGLDPRTSIVIDNLIKEITMEYQITTMVNTHDMNSVLEMGDKIVYLHQGSKWWEGTVEDILRTDNKELNEFIFASKLAQSVKKV